MPFPNCPRPGALAAEYAQLLHDHPGEPRFLYLHVAIYANRMFSDPGKSLDPARRSHQSTAAGGI